MAGHDIPYFLPHGKDEKLEQSLSFIRLRAQISNFIYSH